MALLPLALLAGCSDDQSGGSPGPDTSDVEGAGDLPADTPDSDGGDVSNDPDSAGDPDGDEPDAVVDVDAARDADSGDDASDGGGDTPDIVIDPCEEMAADATDGCDTFIGWAWDGDLCLRLNGCACTGADCDRLYSTRQACEEATSTCFFEALDYQLVLIPLLEGHESATPLGLNSSGRLVGSSGPEPFSNVATAVFVDVPGRLVALDVPEVSFGYARGVNEAGLIVGENQMLPQFWDDGVRTALGVPNGYGSGVARAIDDNGLIIGTFADYDDALPPSPIGARPCYWVNAAAAPQMMVTLGEELPLGTPVAINATGQVAGTLTNDTTAVAGLWPSVFGTPQALPLAADALGAEGYGMNDFGDVVGRTVFGDNRSEAFLYRRESHTSVALPFPEGSFETLYAEAWDLNASGAVVGMSTGPGGVRARLWYGGEVIDLESRVTVRPEGVKYLLKAILIDDMGRIALEVVLGGDLPDTPRTIGLLVPRRR